MRRTMMRMAGMALALGAQLAGAGPAACQGGHTRMRSESSDGLSRLRIELDGEVRFADDEHLAWMAPGARMVIEEYRVGAAGRRVEFRGSSGGGVQRRFFRDGDEVSPDARDEAWIRTALLHPLRESSVLAGPRVERIFRRGGVDAVLAEIREISSDGARRHYYAALLRQPGLGAEGTARVLRDAGTRIASDGDKRMTLQSVLERGAISPYELEALLEAAENIASDGDKSSLLRSVALRGPLSESRVRAAFFRTASGIASDGDKSRVLISTLTREGQPREAVVGSLHAAQGIASDGDRSRVLTSVPPGWLRDRVVMREFQQALQGIASDGDKARVATWMVRSLP